MSLPASQEGRRDDVIDAATIRDKRGENDIAAAGAERDTDKSLTRAAACRRSSHHRPYPLGTPPTMRSHNATARSRVTGT